MSREVKIGILAFITIVVSVWGYVFLKGQNILTRSQTFHARFTNIEQLSMSAPILISGYQVGTVTGIALDPSDMKTIIVTLDVNRSYPIHKNSEVRLISTGLLGGKAIEIAIPGPCQGVDCAEDGQYFEARSIGLLEGFLGGNSGGDMWDDVSGSLKSAFDTINQRLSDPANDGRISSLLRHYDELSVSLAHTSANLNDMITATNKNLNSMVRNLDGIMSNINANNDAIESLLSNAAGITEQLNTSDLTGTVDQLHSTLANVDQTFHHFEKSASELNTVLSNFKSISTSLDNGDGTLGKLIKDQELYENLNRMSYNLDLLLQDFRLNPKRYVNVSVFGKKQKEYELPEDDPAFSDEKEK